ncbi:MAG: hypothetical protein M3405_02570 [Acidobacteriota bacterium]|nr:hypothetical protein [Acidobacteriota bacterium]
MKKLYTIAISLILCVGLTGVAIAQDTTQTTTVTKKEVVQNPDGSWTVIEYPVGKEVMVEIMPTTRGAARIMRMENETMIDLDTSNFGDSAANYFVYAVEPNGKVTYLGPARSEDGMAKTTFKTPLNQFMLVLSPTEGLTTFEKDTPVMFRSAIPKGYAVVPTAITSVPDNKRVAESAEVTSIYQVPLLNVPSYTKMAEIRINFSGDLEGLKGKAYIDPTKDGLTKIKMRFDDMKMAPKSARFVLWASSPDGKYSKLGQVINNGNRQESEIRSETALSDFGLFVTLEEKDVEQPTGKTYTVLKVQ